MEAVLAYLLAVIHTALIPYHLTRQYLDLFNYKWVNRPDRYDVILTIASSKPDGILFAALAFAAVPVTWWFFGFWTSIIPAIFLYVFVIANLIIVQSVIIKPQVIAAINMLGLNFSPPEINEALQSMPEENKTNPDVA